ncbi:hypothetical protein PRK78_006734 [Emydomyces testavorans]|uniref:GDP/GTP exchange factor Sec2 N-terminal domain-containing protein n=1 Tax=Emydomyces testavorans TaxID=2070801 RepID=A0AAF0IP03_9EURO|nr:hypothetical protein PRK78_006734 [Emydomyces testavorans]
MSISDPVPPKPPSSCPRCGFDPAPFPHDSAAAEVAQQRIAELETQIKLLNQRAADTAEKLADYEDEIRCLRSQSQPATTSTSAPPKTPTLPPPQQQATSPSPSPPQQQQPQHNRFATLTYFLPYGRRNNSSTSTSASANGAPLPQTASSPESTTATPPRTADPALTASLQDALQREQKLRKAAESRLTQANSELEELTTQLFSQANEMVAQERKARAKLEERVELLEQRDGEKRRRLDRLEKAIQRVERVRGMVGAGG